MKFKDYYESLGVKRDATQDEIRKAFRKLARKYHPDTSKEKNAVDRFKAINEANEVLSDPEKRKKYDQLGKNWKGGQEFTPPPGWENVQWEYHGAPGAGGGFNFGGGGGGFSDFFETLFGGVGGGGRSAFGGFGGFTDTETGGGRRMRSAPPQRGADVETELTIKLEDAYHGTKKSFELRRSDLGPGQTKRYNVRIPAGTRDGDRLRLSGQGGEGPAGAGDLYIRLRIAPHSLYKVDGDDLHQEVPVTPWEAVLGAKISVPTLDGQATLTLPPGTSSGRTLRLRGQGLAKKSGGRGDLLVSVLIEVPRDLTPKERELFEELAKVSPFKPRGGE